MGTTIIEDTNKFDWIMHSLANSMDLSKESLDKRSKVPIFYFKENDSDRDDRTHNGSINCIVKDLNSAENIYDFTSAAMTYLHKMSNSDFESGLSLWDSNQKVVESFGFIKGYAQQNFVNIFKKENTPFTTELSNDVVEYIGYKKEEIFNIMVDVETLSIDSLKSNNYNDIFNSFIASINKNLVDLTKYDETDEGFVRKQSKIRSCIYKEIKMLSYYCRFAIGNLSFIEGTLYDNMILQEPYGEIYDTYIDPLKFKKVYVMIEDTDKMYETAIQLVNGAKNLDDLRHLVDGSETVCLKDSF